MLSLALVALGFGLHRLAGGARAGLARWGLAGTVGALVLVLLLSSIVLWTARGRMGEDLATLGSGAPAPSQGLGPGYESSLAIRRSLYRLGLRLYAARPVLGWGPGTEVTRDLVRRRVIPISDAEAQAAVQVSHLHSVPLEAAVRFGTLGLKLGLALVAVLLRGYRRLGSGSRDAALRSFLQAGGHLPAASNPTGRHHGAVAHPTGADRPSRGAACSQIGRRPGATAIATTACSRPTRPCVQRPSPSGAMPLTT